jgi:methyl-accepting chemotaxis protein
MLGIGSAITKVMSAIESTAGAVEQTAATIESLATTAHMAADAWGEHVVENLSFEDEDDD